MKTLEKISFIFVLILFLSNCDVVDEGKNEQNIKLELNKSILTKTDSLKGVFTITNNSEKKVEYNFTTGCQLGIKIKNAGVVIIDYPEVCAQVLTSFSLEVNESKEFRFTFPLNDNNSYQLFKGEYIIEAYLLNNYSLSVSKLFTII